MLKTKIKKEIQKIVPKNTEFNVQISERKEHGDYSSNIALVLSQKQNKNPLEVGAELKSKLEKNNIFEKVQVARPGFINFWITEKAILDEFTKFSQRKRLNLNIGKGKKVQVELISANPTGPLHIGHGRMAFYSDVLARLLSAVGYKVVREYYINDSKESNQIKELGKSILGKGDAYRGEYLKSKVKSQKSKIQGKLQKFSDDQLYGEVGYLIASEIQKDNKKFIIKDLGIKIDLWTSEENDLRKKGYFEKAKKAVQKYSYEKDGALWAKTSKFGDDEDRVIIRSDGVPTYFLADIAYHIHKFERRFKKIINVWGTDHQGHVKRLLAVKRMLKWKGDLEILISQLVSLKGGERMSKRRGTIVWLEDLIEGVGLDVTRWFFLEKSLDTHMEFDLELAKEQSQENPVYYVQYAGARIHSILAKSEIRSTKFETPNHPVKAGGTRQANSKFKIQNSKIHPAERDLIKKLLEVYEVLEDAVKDYQVHRLTNYAYDLAYVFSIFYRDVKVLDSGENEANRLALVKITKQTLKNILDLLGIDSPERM